MAPALLLLLLGGLLDGPLDPGAFYLGTGETPKKGSLRLPRDGWIVPRTAPGRVEVRFEERGGRLEIAYFDPKEPLSSPVAGPFLLPSAKGARALRLGETAELEGAPLEWKPQSRALPRLRAVGGDVLLLHLELDPPPAPEAPPPPPSAYRDGDALFVRASMPLWDAEACFLLRRGPSAFRDLRGPGKGAPLLAALVTLGDGAEAARRHAGTALAMRDWGDERGNLPPEEYQRYLAGEYALFELLQAAQRALNALAPERKELEALVPLAVLRHADNARAAFALAEATGPKPALAALRKALGGADPAGATGDALRAAAGRAAREIVGEPPAAWRGFSFDPGSRFATLQRARELLR